MSSVDFLFSSPNQGCVSKMASERARRADDQNCRACCKWIKETRLVYVNVMVTNILVYDSSTQYIGDHYTAW